MHASLDPQALALISGAFGTSLALVRLLEHLVTKRRADAEQVRSTTKAGLLEEIKQSLDQEQSDHQDMLLALKEIATILRERGACPRP